MAKKTITACGLAAAVLLYFLPLFTPVYSQADMTHLSDPAFENSQRVPAVFEHDAHNELANLGDDQCYLCHHMDGSAPDPDDTSEGIPCSDCHYVDAGEDSTGLMDAYHKQCIDCHEERRAGPLACGECHVK